MTSHSPMLPPTQDSIPRNRKHTTTRSTRRTLCCRRRKAKSSRFQKDRIGLCAAFPSYIAFPIRDFWWPCFLHLYRRHSSRPSTQRFQPRRSNFFGFDSLHAGLLFIALDVPYLLLGPVAGWAVDKYGTKPAAVLGFGYLGPRPHSTSPTPARWEDPDHTLLGSPLALWRRHGGHRLS